MKIVVLDGYTMNPRGDNSWDGVGELGEMDVYDFTEPDQIVERAKGAEVVLTNKTPLSRETLEQLPQLRFISVVATGYNVVDVEAARDQGISVSNIPVYGTDSVAQYAIAMMLELCHHIGRHDLAVRQGGWQAAGQFSFWEGTLVELAGKTLGVVGFGRIGQRVAELGHAFGMGVIAYTPRPGEAPGYEPFAFRGLEEVFAEADVVSLHCPQTPDNTGFVNRELLGRMKEEAFLINTSRGGLVDEADLLEALRAGRPAAAATDVASTEPIEEGNPLLKAPNLTITPHMAWATLEARRRLMAMTVENVKAYQQGAPINVVN